MFLCYKGRQGPGNSILKCYQTNKVKPEFRIVPRTGSKQPQQKPPTKLPQINEERVHGQPDRQGAVLLLQPSTQTFHEEDGRAVDKQSPKACVACQFVVMGVVPVPGCCERHLAETPMQGVNIESGERCEGWKCDLFGQISFSVCVNTRICTSRKESFVNTRIIIFRLPLLIVLCIINQQMYL